MSKKTFIFLVSGLIIALGFFVVQAAPSLESGIDFTVPAASKIDFTGTPSTTINYQSYGGYSLTAGLATNAGGCTGDGNCDMPGTGIWNSSGNVGIGTAAINASNKLDVIGGGLYIAASDAHADASLHIQTSYGGFDRLTQIAPTGVSKPGLNLMGSTDAASANHWWAWGPTSGDIWRIQSGTGFSGSAGLSIDNVGNVGINDTTPDYKLDVKGNAQFDDTNTYNSYTWAGGTIQTNSIEILDRVGGSTGDGIYPTLTFHDYGNGGAQFSMEGLTTTLHLGSGQSSSAGTLGVAGGYFSKLKIWGALETTGTVTAAQFVGGGAGITGITATDSTKVAKAGDTMSGDLTMAANNISLGDGKLYLRGIGDTNHYLWNNAADWEELIAYNGTGFKVTSSVGFNMLTIAGGGAATFGGSVNAAGGLYDAGTRVCAGSCAANGGSANYANYANYLSPNYAGGQQLNPQTYFNMNVGLKVAMTGYPIVWADTVWINGYAGGDVLNMIALHTARNGEARMWLSSQASNSTSFGTAYEFITTRNIASQSVNYANSAGSAPNGGNQNAAYLVAAGDGNGLKFWASDSYKISMGVGGLYQYGPVTDYSIKTQMDSGSPGRGFTWGRQDVAPIAGLNSTSGNMQIAGSMTATSFVYTSDQSLKKNIATIKSPLEKIMQLRGVTFNWKKDNAPGVGLIAQEVEKVFPELVVGKDGEKGVQYGNLVAPLIEAVKEQQRKIDQLETRITILEMKK